MRTRDLRDSEALLVLQSSLADFSFYECFRVQIAIIGIMPIFR